MRLWLWLGRDFVTGFVRKDEQPQILEGEAKTSLSDDFVKEKFRLALGRIDPIFTALRAGREGLCPRKTLTAK